MFSGSTMGFSSPIRSIGRVWSISWGVSCVAYKGLDSLSCKNHPAVPAAVSRAMPAATAQRRNRRLLLTLFTDKPVPLP